MKKTEIRKKMATAILTTFPLISAIAYAGPLSMPSPLTFDAGPLGKLDVQGIASAFGFWQDNMPAITGFGGKKTGADISNGMVIIQKTTGQLQFYAQAGVFNYPVVGVSYTSTPNTINDFGALPIAYIKYAPTSDLSFEIGKLPALLGAESNFTYQNINIQRGLLFNVEPGVSRGIQANYSTGPFSASISWNDGYYSNRFNWITGLFSYAINGANTLSLYAGGNVGHTGNLGVGNYSTDSYVNSSLAADNSDIYGLIYEYSSGSWMIEPYLQYMHTPANAAAGITSGSSNYGGALLADYSFTNSISLAGRVEYIAATGTPGDGGVSGADILGYGNGSHAWTITVTPTYQDGGFFARAELSYVDVSNYTAAFGANGTNGTQLRGLVETGFMF